MVSYIQKKIFALFFEILLTLTLGEMLYCSRKGMIAVRMKEVCERTGLTDRAVRLYIDNGLLSPVEESSYTGRKSIHFSEADVEILDAIATLRKADFSIDDIRDMQLHQDRTHTILDMHKQKLTGDI